MFNWLNGDESKRLVSFLLGNNIEHRESTQNFNQIGFDDGVFCDHINHNGLDNRRANLRPATRSQNMCNRPKAKLNCRSKYKGVSFRTDQKQWVAEIQVNGKSIFPGYFNDEVGAAKAYDRAARKYHGEYAVTNFLLTKGEINPT